MTKQKEEVRSEEEEVEEQVEENCKDAEKALTTRDACDYTAKEKIRRAAKLLEEKYLKEGREDKIGTISTEIRSYFDNENHKDYASRVLSEVDNRKYMRGWSRDLRRELINELDELKEAVLDMCIAIEEGRFPIESDPEKKLQKLQKYILGMHAFTALIQPVVDKRWGADLLSWCDIIENYYEQGGTYASSKSAVPVADLINPKTGKPIMRKITKEQIDAVHPKLLQNMLFITNNFIYFIEMLKDWNSNYKEIQKK